MASSSALDELVRAYRAARSRGEPIAPEVLCRNCPELLADFLRRLQAEPTTDIPQTQAPPSADPLATQPNDAAVRADLCADAEPLPGYRLVRLLGKGGFGEVWEALAPGGFRVAFKFVPLEGRAGEIELQALEIIRNLRHRNLLTVFGTWQTAGRLVIGMELADATLWDEFGKASASGKPGLPRRPLVRWSLDAARVIDYLNKPRHFLGGTKPVGIQHGDIKPQNILLVGQGAKVGDFGLVRLLRASVDRHVGGMTPLYAAPEMLDGRVSRWSDQYSLAVTWCQLRGGRLPFAGESVAEVRRQQNEQPPDLSMLPEAERPIVARALACDPRRRWPDCRAFVKALAECTADPAGATGPIPGKPATLPKAPQPSPAPRLERVTSRVPQQAQSTLPTSLPPPAPPQFEARSSNKFVLTAALSLLATTVVTLVLLFVTNAAPRPGDTGRLTDQARVNSTAPNDNAKSPESKVLAQAKPIEPPAAPGPAARPEKPDEAPAPQLRSLESPPKPEAVARSPSSDHPPETTAAAKSPSSEHPPKVAAAAKSPSSDHSPKAVAAGAPTRPGGVDLTRPSGSGATRPAVVKNPPTEHPPTPAAPPAEPSESRHFHADNAPVSQLPPPPPSAAKEKPPVASAPVQKETPRESSAAPSAPVTTAPPPPSPSQMDTLLNLPVLTFATALVVALGALVLRTLRRRPSALSEQPAAESAPPTEVPELTDREEAAVSDHADDVSSEAIAVALDGVAATQCYRGHEDAVWALAIAADGSCAASGGMDHAVRVWDFRSMGDLQSLAGHSEGVTALAYLAGTQRIASAGLDGTVRLWQANGPGEVRRFEGHAGRVFGVASAPDGRRLASCGADGTIRLWDVETGAELRQLQGHTGWVYAVAYAGARLVSAGADGTVRLWDPGTGTELARLQGHSAAVRSVAVSPDGKRAASGGEDNAVILWDLATGEEGRWLEGHKDWVRAIAWTPDGRRVVTGGDDETLRVWDATTGALLQRFDNPGGSVLCVAVAPDGHSVLAGSDDATVQKWQLPG